MAISRKDLLYPWSRPVEVKEKNESVKGFITHPYSGDLEETKRIMPGHCSPSGQVSGALLLNSVIKSIEITDQSRIPGKTLKLSVYVQRMPIWNMLAQKGADITKNSRINPITNLYLLVG